VVQSGQPVKDVAAGEPFREKVQSGELVLGGQVSSELRDFAKTLCCSIDASQYATQSLIEIASLTGQVLPPKYAALVARSEALACNER